MNKTIYGIIIALIMILGISTYLISAMHRDVSVLSPQASGQIYLYGESHGVKKDFRERT